MSFRASAFMVIGLIFAFGLSNAAVAQTAWFVDDDAPNDPGPGNPAISDPLEDGTAQHPFDAIQEGIDAAANEDTVIVADGTYVGAGNKDLDYGGKAITVRSENGYAGCVIDCEDLGRAFYFHTGETSDSLVAGFTIRNVRFSEANANGAIRCDNSSPTINDCQIYACTIGVRWENGGRPRLENCYIHDGGWGIYGRDCRPGYIRKCHVTRCDNGIDLIARTTIISPIEIDGCLIEECGLEDPDFRGVTVSCSSSSGSIDITDCVIRSNVSQHGAGVKATGYVNIENCELYDNSAADTQYVAVAGAIYISSTGLCRISNCYIHDNSAESRGAIFVSYAGGVASTVIIDQCRLWNNSSDANGGGLCVFPPESYGTQTLSLRVSNTSFVGNSAGIGGAMYLKFDDGVYDVPCEVNLQNNIFSGNTSTSDGGAIAIDPSRQCSISNCLFEGNSAAATGGAVRCNNDLASISNCVFVANQAAQKGGGLYAMTGLTAAANNVFWDNNAPLGSQVAVSAPQRIDFSHNLSMDGASGVYSETGSFNFDVTNLAADPLFADPDGLDDDPATWEDNNFRLLPGSPCIDAGLNAAVPADTLDLDGDGDTTEPLPFDLDGSPRFADDLGMIDRGDAGQSGLPVVDIGAYEFQGQTCVGDLNGDYQINLADLAQLLGHYGLTEGAVYSEGDFDADGDVDLADLAELLGRYGDPCP